MQRAISCVSSGTISVQQSSDADRSQFMFLLNNREPAAIGSDLLLKVFFVLDINARQVRDRRDSDASLIGYSYTVLRQPDTEVVAYHWHRDTPDTDAQPHIHFGPASARRDSAVRPGELHKVHFPTGVVSLEAVIRLAIDEFGVEPRRPDWEVILQ